MPYTDIYDNEGRIIREWHNKHGCKTLKRRFYVNIVLVVSVGDTIGSKTYRNGRDAYRAMKEWQTKVEERRGIRTWVEDVKDNSSHIDGFGVQKSIGGSCQCKCYLKEEVGEIISETLE